MNRISIIELEWNCYNGFIFKVLEFEPKRYIDRALFGISFSKSFLYVDLLFFSFKIFDKTTNLYT